ncbi:MAG TPA: alpha/beta hydrolase [Bryobacteraceae bacterium]|nr:alpha/beta hydrolase [Bryobacteraceae bacterium]
MTHNVLATGIATAALKNDSTPQIHYRTVLVEGVEVFYREAGRVDAPALLLLHGFPTSSHMFRELIPRLADHYRVVAPDYPGFGHSAMPDRARFAYTFESLARTIARFTEAIGLERYGLYVMDYGAPVGYRLALAHPERVTALIVQNGNAYEEGLGEFWTPIKKYWNTPSPANRDALRVLLKPESTRWQYTNGVADTSLLNPDAWTIDQIGLDRPGNDEIQLDLFYDYRTNLPLYPQFQAYFREHQPPALVVWGKNDLIFLAEGAMPYRRDLPKAEVHLFDTGHFALETHGSEITQLIQGFLARGGER